jgi:phenylacetate-coenzyme A ligase PaaK-like adenylate-forming protein
VEHAGASALPAGHLAPPERLVGICEAYRPTILTGDTSQIVQFASYVESKRVGASIKFDKIMYTSEPMSRQQMSFVQKVFGRAEANLHVVSVYGSAETGVWAFGNSAINITQVEDSSALIFDSKHMIVEVMPLDFHTKPENRKLPCKLELEKVGFLVVTSLQRLRNPLVRYFTGDIGSVHLLPDSARSQISGDSESLRVLRLYGRDIRHSISWQGEYFDLSQIQKAMSDPSWGILQWQVVADHDISYSNCESLEVRLMRADGFKGLISLAELTSKLKRMFCVHELNEHLFHIKMASSEEFIRSGTGNKVIRFVEKR